MWSYFLVPEIIRAAKFCSDCSLEIFLFDVFDHSVEQCGTVIYVGIKHQLINSSY